MRVAVGMAVIAAAAGVGVFDAPAPPVVAAAAGIAPAAGVVVGTAVVAAAGTAAPAAGVAVGTVALAEAAVAIGTVASGATEVGTALVAAERTLAAAATPEFSCHPVAACAPQPHVRAQRCDVECLPIPKLVCELLWMSPRCRAGAWR